MKSKKLLLYLPVWVSISLVLLLVGFFALFLLHMKKMQKEMKEGVQMSVYLKDSVDAAGAGKLRQWLLHKSFIQTADTISPKQGMEMLKKELGENPEAVLEANPLPFVIDLRFQEGFVETDNLRKFQMELMLRPEVQEVVFNQAGLEQIRKNVESLSVMLAVLILLMLAVTVALIHNLIRLLIFSRRNELRSMKYIGATRGFIRRPFLQAGAAIGALSGMTAAALLFVGSSYLAGRFPALSVLKSAKELLLLSAGLLLAGVLVSLFSTILAVNRYLKGDMNDLS